MPVHYASAGSLAGISPVTCHRGQAPQSPTQISEHCSGLPQAQSVASARHCPYSALPANSNFPLLMTSQVMDFSTSPSGSVDSAGRMIPAELNPSYAARPAASPSIIPRSNGIRRRRKEFIRRSSIAVPPPVNPRFPRGLPDFIAFWGWMSREDAAGGRGYSMVSR